MVKIILGMMCTLTLLALCVFCVAFVRAVRELIREAPPGYYNERDVKDRRDAVVVYLLIFASLAGWALQTIIYI